VSENKAGELEIKLPTPSLQERVLSQKALGSARRMNRVHLVVRTAEGKLKCCVDYQKLPTDQIVAQALPSGELRQLHGLSQCVADKLTALINGNASDEEILATINEIGAQNAALPQAVATRNADQRNRPFRPVRRPF
jgi:hypothetical protein